MIELELHYRLTMRFYELVQEFATGLSWKLKFLSNLRVLATLRNKMYGV